jgi:hypothetical protein
VLDVSGRLVAQGSVRIAAGLAEYIVPLSKLAGGKFLSGVYFARLRAAGGAVASSKLALMR